MSISVITLPFLLFSDMPGSLEIPFSTISELHDSYDLPHSITAMFRVLLSGRREGYYYMTPHTSDTDILKQI